MKKKISISIDSDTHSRVIQAISKGKFRNTSHAFEFAVKEVLE